MDAAEHRFVKGEASTHHPCRRHLKRVGVGEGRPGREDRRRAGSKPIVPPPFFAAAVRL